jgi:hypothetical protein
MPRAPRANAPTCVRWTRELPPSTRNGNHVFAWPCHQFESFRQRGKNGPHVASGGIGDLLNRALLCPREDVNVRRQLDFYGMRFASRGPSDGAHEAQRANPASPRQRAPGATPASHGSDREPPRRPPRKPSIGTARILKKPVISAFLSHVVSAFCIPAADRENLAEMAACMTVRWHSARHSVFPAAARRSLAATNGFFIMKNGSDQRTPGS